MSDQYYAQQKIEPFQRETQATQQAWDTPPPAPPARTIDAGLQHLGERLALATDLLGTLEAHLDPVLADVPVPAHEWPLALEPTCALAQQILERIEQVQHLSARLSAVLERLAL